MIESNKFSCHPAGNGNIIKRGIKYKLKNKLKVGFPLWLVLSCLIQTWSNFVRIWVLVRSVVRESFFVDFIHKVNTRVKAGPLKVCWQDKQDTQSRVVEQDEMRSREIDKVFASQPCRLSFFLSSSKTWEIVKIFHPN